MMYQCFSSSASLTGAGSAGTNSDENSPPTTLSSIRSSPAGGSSCCGSGAGASDPGVCSTSDCPLSAGSMSWWELSISGILLYETLLDVHEARLVLGNASLLAISDQLKANEAGLLAGTAAVKGALNDLTNLAQVLNAVTSLVGLVAQIVPME